MITFILIGMIVAICLMQFFFMPKIQNHLYIDYSFDTKLAEPGEKIGFSSKIASDWILPIVYVALYQYMPEGATIIGKKKNRDSHRLFLLPYNSFQSTLFFTLPKRGVYKKGRYFVESGDFLGFKSWVESGSINADITIMPKRCEDEMVLNALGGYLGDISVRRFILEDPVLTIGYLDYTGREPMKKISWKQSAKVGKLMVNNNDYTTDATAVVLNMDLGTSEEKEKCLEIVRTVCEELEKVHVPYQFLSNGDAGILEEGYGRRHMHQIMKNLGKSQLTSFFTFDNLIERCIRERKRSRSYFVVSAPLRDKEKDALIRLQRFSEYEICVLEAEVSDDENS